MTKERDICERLEERAREPTEAVMRQWDRMRHYVESLPGASLPRDEFEGLVGWLVEDCAEAAATIRALREAGEMANAVLAQLLAAGINQPPPSHDDIDAAFWALDSALGHAP